MKKKFLLLIMCVMLFLAGCGSKSGSGSSSEGNGLKEQKEATEEIKKQKQKESLAENGQYTWQEITVTLPEEWEGRYVISEKEDGFSIYQKASYNEENGSGYLCGLRRMDEYINYGWG